jgi:capsular polysaccharide biosynthesis protein
MQRTEPSASSTVRYDLLDIFQTLLRRRNFILVVTGLALLVGVVIYLITPPSYNANAEVILGNPMYSDRSRLFSQGASVDYFAPEQINDRALAIANSDQVKREIVTRNQLQNTYNINMAKTGAMDNLLDRFGKDFRVRRTEFGSIMVSFKDKNPQLAAQVTNSAVGIIEENFHKYISGLRLNARNAVRNRIAQSDSAVRVLTDSLVAMRERTGIYDIISPNRYGLTTGTVRSTDARAIEEIQNLEAVKDQYVIDRSRYMATAAESNTGIDEKELPFIQIITPAAVPGKRDGLGLVATLIGYTLAGLFFSVLWVVFSGWYHRVATAAAQREAL